MSKQVSFNFQNHNELTNVIQWKHNELYFAIKYLFLLRIPHNYRHVYELSSCFKSENNQNLHQNPKTGIIFLWLLKEKEKKQNFPNHKHHIHSPYHKNTHTHTHTQHSHVCAWKNWTHKTLATWLSWTLSANNYPNIVYIPGYRIGSTKP